MNTARWRLLPEFAIIGTQKGGTTSLFSLLTHHPQVLKTSVKEIHYFDSHYAQGIDWYKSHFASDAWAAFLRGLMRRPVMTGEATPYYMFHPHAMRHLRRDFPDMRLIVMLRNPVDRAFSHYQHNCRHGWETLSYEEALAAEDQRIDNDAARMTVDEGFESDAFRNYSYRRRGVYIDQLASWLPVYDPRQLMVIRSEDFFANPLAVYGQVLEYLNLDRWFPRSAKAKNVGHYEKQNAPRCSELAAFYKPHNTRLYDWLGRDMEW